MSGDIQNTSQDFCKMNKLFTLFCAIKSFALNSFAWTILPPLGKEFIWKCSGNEINADNQARLPLVRHSCYNGASVYVNVCVGMSVSLDLTGTWLLYLWLDNNENIVKFHFFQVKVRAMLAEQVVPGQPSSSTVFSINDLSSAVLILSFARVSEFEKV